MRKPSQPNECPFKQKVMKWIEEFQRHKCQESQEKIVTHYHHLVESIARKYSKGKSYHEDIVQVGMIGLLGAVRRYDRSFGKSFEAFAIPTIVGEIKRYLRDKTWSVHVPRRIKELGPKIQSTVEKLTCEMQRSPQVKEIAAYLDITEEEVLEAMEMVKGYQTLSVDHTIEADSEGGTMTLLDMVGNEEKGYEKVDQRLDLEKVLPVLNEREWKIIQYTYLENMSQKDAGEKLGISQMHVSRLQRRAVQKLKKAIRSETMNSEK
ncbi:RNA polymerase sigma factor SigB [Bacillus sp. FSL W8-0102]|uniref:RNA polymerase sigma factor SigB n=1 Tax=unclassified Bacillus (in: firmicutes) TaxID=185979 RepID=UPI0030FA5D68